MGKNEIKGLDLARNRNLLTWGPVMLLVTCDFIVYGFGVMNPFFKVGWFLGFFGFFLTRIIILRHDMKTRDRVRKYEKRFIEFD